MSEALNMLAEFGPASGASVICREVAAICPGDYWSQSEGMKSRPELEAASTQPVHRPMNKK